jgi:hypothetical protein
MTLHSKPVLRPVFAGPPIPARQSAGVQHRGRADAAAPAATPTRPPIRSRRGFWGAIALLLALPVTVLSQIVFPNTDGVVVHFGLALSFILISFAVFDFRTPAWANRIASVAVAALSAVFIIQGISEAVPNDALNNFAFDLLGQGLEGVLGDVFMLWCVALLFSDSAGKTRLFGVIALTAVVGAEVARYGAMLAGGSTPEALKALLILPVIWLLLESRRPRPSEETDGLLAEAA